MSNEQLTLQEIVKYLVERGAISGHIRWEESDKAALLKLYNELKR